MFEGLLQPMHLMVILIVVLVVFGPGKLSELGETIGKSISGFKRAMAESDEKPANRAASGNAEAAKD